jgi:hypothetical protein
MNKVFILCVLMISCSRHFRPKLIAKEKQTYYYYIDSKKIGKNFTIECKNKTNTITYSIKTGSSGIPMHLIRYSSFDPKRMFLITDTLDKGGPNYLGNEMNGYFWNHQQYRNLESVKKVIVKPSREEQILFDKLDSIAIKKGIKLTKIDCLSALGWFYYFE